MGIGALIGGILSNISSVITSVSLSFAAGLILYTICKEILPESIELWHGRLSAIGTVIGIIVGKIFITIIH
jgi:ZIP family zinc transporter